MVDGTPFDWKKYQGKVVLVDFSASLVRAVHRQGSRHRKELRGLP